MSIDHPLPWLLAPLRRLLSGAARLPHALLVTGPAGIGASEFGQLLAASLLCEARRADASACGHCDACGWFLQGNHPDFRRLAPLEADEAAEGKGTRARREIKIDQVRALADFIGIGAHRAGARVVLVDPAQALNNVAANALLKTLEEPTDRVHFVLVAEQAELLPATIRSRTVRVPLAAPPAEIAIEWLRERTGADRAQTLEWLALAAGAPTHALAFAQPGHAAAHRLVLETLAGLPDTSPMSAADVLTPLTPAQWLPLLQCWVLDLGRVAAGASPMRYAGQQQRLAHLAGRTGRASLASVGRWLIAQSTLVEHPLNARLFCEDVLLRYCRIFEGRR